LHAYIARAGRQRGVHRHSNPSDDMPARLTHRLLALAAIAAASVTAAACSDAPLTPTAPQTLGGRNTSAADSGHGTPTPGSDSTRRDSSHADSSHGGSSHGGSTSGQSDSARSDTLRVGTGVLWGMTVENYVFQWHDANGVAHDSAGYRGVAGVSVAVYATTRPDSTSGTVPQERLVATLHSDATGQVRSDKLPDGWYTVRATWSSGGAMKSASASGQLVRGYQYPTILFLNLN
jgi:hypothetical protein